MSKAVAMPWPLKLGEAAEGSLRPVDGAAFAIFVRRSAGPPAYGPAPRLAFALRLTWCDFGQRTTTKLNFVISRTGIVRSTTHIVGGATSVHELLPSDVPSTQ